jgi:L1 cell adhesion molecule like protein
VFNRETNKAEIIKNELGHGITPSMVSFNNEERLIGQQARNQEPLNPENTVYDAKRMIGKRFSDRSLQADMKYWPFKVIKGPSDLPKIVVNCMGEEKSFAPEQISAMVLQYLKENAERKLGRECKDAVITIPAYFTDTQREATKQAGAIAGFNVLQLFQEPSAAALAFGFEKPRDEEHTVFIFDLGGGTFDVTILGIKNGRFIIKGTEGDSHLGGEDFDNVLVKYFAERFEEKEKVNLFEDNKECRYSLKLLKIECEKIKIQLSDMDKVNIQIDHFYKDLTLEDTITRKKFNDLNDDLFKKCIEPIETVLEVAGCTTEDITDLILVGGSSHIPRVKEILAEQFGGMVPIAGVDAEEAVAIGAAIKCMTLHKRMKPPKPAPKPIPEDD